MLPNIYLSFGVIGAACWGQSAATLTGPSCRTPAMHPEAKQESRVAMAQNAANAINSRMSGDIIQIPTYFHVVAKSKSVQDGYLSVRSLVPYIHLPPTPPAPSHQKQSGRSQVKANDYAFWGYQICRERR